jgi:oligosaccharide repeat unit polymerase
MATAKDSIRPSGNATALFLVGLATTLVAAEGTTPTELAHEYALGVAASFAASLLADYRRDLRNLVRADLMAIASLYFLTLFEFLGPQPIFNTLVNMDEVRPALAACIAGFAGLAIGRHVSPQPGRNLQRLLRREVSPKLMISLFTIAVVGGYFNMLFSVGFDFFAMLHWITAPRFTQPWGRDRYGDWKALLGELGMIIYLIPPIAGIVLAQRAKYTPQQRAFVAIGYLFTLFYGFASGTRNIFATYLATFLVAYAFTVEAKRKKELIMVSAATAGLMLFATVMMLQFRNIGLSNYLAGDTEVQVQRKDESFFVDYNLYVISKLVGIFPRQYDYLGFEIPYLAIIRPIPRAMWPDKPKGMSVSIEDAVGVEGLTLASSFVGEAYMSGGLIGVLLTGLAFGAISGWWNRVGHPDNSPFGQLVFASGFFAAVISMRSMFVFTTAVLPTIAALVLGNWLLSRRLPRRAAAPPDG